MKTTIVLLISIFALFSDFKSTLWQRGKVDSQNNLIIVTMKNRENCNHLPQYDTIAVDKDWSVVLYCTEFDSTFCIFNNIKKELFITRSLSRFILELKKIPAKTIVREIEKCTMPFSYNLSPKDRKRIEGTLQRQGSKLEYKLMYCYCCALEMKYAFD